MQNKESRQSTHAAIPLIFIIMLMGFTTGLCSLMNIFGTVCAGAFYSHVMVGAPYLMGAIILVIAGLMMLRPSGKESRVA
jgi:predicted branched-subunit amino acid permease